MHETDMTKALIMTVQDWWESQPEQRAVEKIHLVVGEFTCVEPDSLKFAFDAQTRHTFLENAELVIRETPLIAYCHSCQAEYRPTYGQHYSCPTCEHPMDDIRSGRELKIDRVEWATTSEFSKVVFTEEVSEPRSEPKQEAIAGSA